MDDERAVDWVTYKEAATMLGCTAEVVRLRALRGKWPRRRGNDGRARVQLPEDARDVRTPVARGVRTPVARDVRTASDASLIKALEAHVETLKEQLAAADGREAQRIADLAAASAQTKKAIEAFASIVERLEAMAAARRPWWRRLTGVRGRGMEGHAAN